MKKIMISAMQSGSGKTVATALLALMLKKEDLKVRVVKCGPDYIDPIFHNTVLSDNEPGGCNIDLFLQGREKALTNLKGLADDTDIVLLEGVMGFYDGIAGTSENSAWDIAKVTDTPVILVIRPSGIGPTLCALIKGMLSYKENSHIAGVLLNDCREPLYRYLKPLIEEGTGLKVLGYLKHFEEARIESRHLGLSSVTKKDKEGLMNRFEELARLSGETVDLSEVLELAKEG
ncbi:MAG: AAA family ATPase [Lachnospiraceae bacterium]|nr:AAA family ATPase [Lachnospiraceae bacterium]